MIESFYVKHKQILMYIFFGGVTFFLNLFLFIAIDKFFAINELVNNIICWLVCVLFQYITNKTWVFNVSVDSMFDLMTQIALFFGGRIFTLAVEEIILAVFIVWLAFDSMVVKLIAQIVVIILNYVVSKLLVFKK